MHQTLIEYYRAIESASQRMREAAKVENWDDVTRLEGVCAVLIEQLRFNARTEKLLPDDYREKVGIMQRILRNDAQIRHLAEPWMAKLESRFDGLQQTLH
jgi:flagellar protein FliT